MLLKVYANLKLNLNLQIIITLNFDYLGDQSQKYRTFVA